MKHISAPVPYLLSIACVVAILWLTLAPDPLPDTSAMWFEGADKVAHGCMFGGLLIAWCLDRLWLRKPITVKMLCTAATLCMAFGALVELLQHWLPTGRSGDVADLRADFYGITLAFMLLYIVKRK